MRAMQKIRMLQPVLTRFCLPGIFLVLSACGGGQEKDRLATQSLPPGMHVYKDPVSGEFVPQPPSDRFNPRALPQALQQINKPTGTAPVSKPAQEYKSPANGGGILLDLPAPYSDKQK
ncbi:hypothetical protein MNBD_GAMMA24-133 [hydrothermal vent metagenome]|uniref:Lipoprotein n=1 Tax=hydrothermal vent metagenome TaxID=652676 RepID=A0A3B1B7X2_9ZZZZ